MSEATASNIEIVYVRLLGEGTDVARPVFAKRISASVFEIIDAHDVDFNLEEWEFPPGSVVVCREERIFHDRALLAVALFDGAL